VVLAYERGGKPMTGREGLIQLVVGADEFASRYSHWVSELRVREGSGLITCWSPVRTTKTSAALMPDVFVILRGFRT
jgi:hypothetical protein